MKTELIAFINTSRNDEIRTDARMQIDCGYANGYVAIPPGHPCHGKSSLELADESGIIIHGGITYASPAVYGEEYNGMKVNPAYIGMKAMVLNGAEYLNGDENFILDDWWIIGFDTCHFGDSILRWTRNQVIKETLNLKAQLKEIANNQQSKQA